MQKRKWPSLNKPGFPFWLPSHQLVYARFFRLKVGQRGFFPLRAGKSAAAALAVGFSKAFGTLVDTHVTTVVSCAILFFFGTPAVKGFAATLVRTAERRTR